MAAQSTSAGRQIHRLQTVGDSLVAFYGDYDANTGPIHLLALDLAAPGAAPADLGTLATEETWNLSENAGELLLPYVDPQGGQASTGHYAHRVGGVWSLDQTITPTPEHVFDGAITSQGLWLSGSAYGVNPSVGGAATVWHQPVGGSWSASLELDDPADTGYARVYLLMAFGDELLAVITDVSTNSTYHWNGSTWAQVTAIGSYTDGVPFNLAGTPYWLCRGSELSQFPFAIAQPVNAIALDSTVQAQVQAQLTSEPIVAMAAGAAHVWLLDDTTQIWRGDTDGTFRVVGALDSLTGVASMAVDEARGVIYLGCAEGIVKTANLP